jgi:hypothetical protein
VPNYQYNVVRERVSDPTRVRLLACALPCVS